jgi:hypothetical protein
MEDFFMKARLKENPKVTKPKTFSFYSLSSLDYVILKTSTTEAKNKKTQV